jgi:2-keto-4-pentenoate hydratase/2-oxohepta-3-ene-1,7-dioic acid hydratase in catechol pathway
MAAARVASGSKHTAKIGTDGIFLKAASSIVGPSEGVPMRFLERRTDHELELVVVIGKQGTDISQEDALDHIAGYSLGLDMTIRGPEDRSFRKSPDGYAVLGPWMVTADEIADPDNVPLVLKVERRGAPTGPTPATDLYGIRRLIEFASSFYTLYPGDVYYTGTPSGVGPVKPGDVITLGSPLIGEMDGAGSGACARPVLSLQHKDLTPCSEGRMAATAISTLSAAEGAPVVYFAHSLAADSGMWSEQVPAFLAAGYRVLRVDMRGHRRQRFRARQLHDGAAGRGCRVDPRLSRNSEGSLSAACRSAA